MAVLFNGGCRMFYTRPSDGRTYCFIPVPLLADSKEILRTDAGDRLAVIHRLTFNGTLLPTIPELSGVPDFSTCISLLDRKRDQLEDALSEDRGDLLVIDASGYPIISAKPLITALDFPGPERLVQQSPYTVTFEFEETVGSGYVRSYEDNWDFGQQENDTVSVTHSVNAVGIPRLDIAQSAAESAKNFVLTRLGLDKTKAFAIQTPFVSALVAVNSLDGYNRVFSESYSETAGSYSVQETFILSSGAFLDDRTIEESFERDEENFLVSRVSINGTVQGYGNTTFERFQNALNGFDSFVVPQILFNNSSGVETKQKSVNRVAGQVNYSIVRIPSSGGPGDLINRTISRQLDRNEDGSVTQTVTTSAAVRPSSPSGIELAINFCYAENYPIDFADPIFDASLSGNLVTVGAQIDHLARSFSLTRSFIDQTTPLYREEYSIERTKSVDSSILNISVQGTVIGLGIESTTKSTNRFLSASGAFFGTIQGLARSRALHLLPAGYCLTDLPITDTVGINELQGIISYSQTFDSRFKTANTNVLSEEIEVEYQLPASVIAVIPVPGKPTGPILQDQETVTGRQKSLSISYKMAKQGTSCSGNSLIPSEQALAFATTESDILVNNTQLTNPRGERPISSGVFKTQDTIRFVRQSYDFTRNVVWQYL